MSDFLVCINKVEQALTIKQLTPVQEVLTARFGRQQTQLHGGVGYVVDHCVTTNTQEPDAPLKRGSLLLFWDGRIDNRQDMYALLRQYLEQPLSELSDEALFLCLYQHAQRYLDKLIGPFVAVVVDVDRKTVFAARDAMGARNLVYAQNAHCLCLATCTRAINAFPGFEFQLNQQRTAQFFAFQYDNDDKTFAQNVFKLLPGHKLQWSPGVDIKLTTFWLPDPTHRIRYRNPQEYIEHFRELFYAAVEARLPATTPVATLTSGGWDSAPMTAVAAQLKQAEIVPVSWVFDRFKECDERQFTDDLFDRYKLQPVYVNCDTAHPFSDNDYWSINPDRPFDTPYRAKHTRAYSAMEKRGIRVALSGMAGDDLYAGTDLIAYELLRSGQWRDIKPELMRRRPFTSTTVEFLKRHFFWYTRLWYRVSGPQRLLPEFLTDTARELVGEPDNFLGQLAPKALRPRQYDRLVGSYWSDALAAERFFSRQHGVELRYPFRDRRLVEFMLQIPSRYLVFDGVHRQIIRQSIGDLLPLSIQRRRRKTSFIRLLENGMSENQIMIDRLLKGQQWSHFVNLPPVDRESDRYLMVLWQAAYFEYWCNR